MGIGVRYPRYIGRRFVVGLILVAVVTLAFGEAKDLHSKSQIIHKFFVDDDDDLFDLPEEESLMPSSPSPFPPKTTNSLLTFPLSETVKQVTDAVSSSDGNGLSSGRNSSRDRCFGIRCRVGRVCEVDGESTGGAWCVCAGVGHCKDRGRRVCGSDGNFYPSHCELHRVACVRNERMRVRHDERSCIRRRQVKTTGEHGADEHGTDEHGTDEHGADDNGADEHGVVEHRAGGEHEHFHDSKTQPSAGSLLHQLTDTERHQTRFPPSTRRTTVDSEPSAMLPEPKQSSSPGSCSEDERRRIVKKVLQKFCEKTEIYNCTDIDNWKIKTVKSLFGFYDKNSNQLLDYPEIDAMQMDLTEHDYPNPEKIRESCRLTDVVKSYPETSYLSLNSTEFYALLGISSVIQEESLKVFTVSATVGTSLEMKCDTVRKTEFTWRRNGDILTDNTDSKIKVFGDGSLYIREVFLYHVGNYSCEERSNRRIIQTHLVSVYVPPIVRVNPKIRFLAPRSTITIDCYADGIPAPDVSWMANDMPLPNRPDHYSLLNNGLSLQIRDVDYSVDTGTFKCRASNFVGLTEDVSTVFIENDDSYQASDSDELYELFVVFHAEGYTVYEPGRCHMHHVVKGDYEVESGDAISGIATLCEANATCEWGTAVNVKNMFIYVSQPKLNRIIVIELQDRFNPVEAITVDARPLEINYVEHLDQVWVSCSANAGGSRDTDVLRTLVIIQRASANVRHSVIHTQPIRDQFDKVRRVFLPPVNTFKQVFDYGFVVSKELSSVHKIDLNTMTYVKELSLKSLGDCVVDGMTFVPLAGKTFVNCKETSDMSDNLTSLCFAIDYVTDKITSTSVACGDSFVSPDSRNLVVVSSTRRNLQVYRVEDDGSIETKFNREIDLRVGELTFKESEGGYDLFANSPDRPDLLYMSLTSGYMDIIKDDTFVHSSDNESKTQDTKSQEPIVSGGIFSDYVMTSLTDTVRVIDVKRRHVQCEWQDVKMASVIAWVEVLAR